MDNLSPAFSATYLLPLRSLGGSTVLGGGLRAPVASVVHSGILWSRWESFSCVLRHVSASATYLLLLIRRRNILSERCRRRH